MLPILIRRNELSAEERKPECIMDIPQLKRKEVSCYKPSDLWTQEDDSLFLSGLQTNVTDAIIQWPETYQHVHMKY